jgi:hypothetical protein
MSNYRDILNFTVNQIQTAVAAVSGQFPTGMTVTIAPGWPSENMLQDMSRNNNAIINVYDRGGGKNATRWMPFLINDTPVTPGVNVTVSSSNITIGASASVTLGGTLINNDAVAIIVLKGFNGTAVIVNATSNSTLTSMASALASGINSNSLLSPWVSAFSSGSVITLINITNVPLTLDSYVGNTDTQQWDYTRVNREIQVVGWFPSEAIRELIMSSVESQFSQTQAQFGGILGDGNYARFIVMADHLQEVFILKDIYRMDVIIDMEYGKQQNVTAYTVLGPFADFISEPPAAISSAIDFTEITITNG